MGAGTLVCHVLLAEADSGLVLVDTGFGTLDCGRPARFGRFRPYFFRPSFDMAEAAVNQVEALGYHRSDVRHIITTHFDADHIGGLADFPTPRSTSPGPRWTRRCAHPRCPIESVTAQNSGPTVLISSSTTSRGKRGGVRGRPGAHRHRPGLRAHLATRAYPRARVCGRRRRRPLDTPRRGRVLQAGTLEESPGCGR